MEVVLYSVEEEGKELTWRWILSSHSDFLHVHVLGFKSEDISLVLGNQTWNISSGKHSVDGFQEGLLLNFSVSHDEGNSFSCGTSLSVKFLDVVLHGLEGVSLGQSNLEVSLLTNVRRNSSQRLFSRSTDSDEEAVSGWRVNNSGDSEQMSKSIIEDNQVHLLGNVFLIELVQFVVNSLSDSLNVWAGFINERSNFLKLSIFVVDIFSLEVSEEVVSHKDLLIESKLVSEFLFSDSVKDVREYLLVWLVGKLIKEGSVTLMSPESDQEKFLSNLFLHLGAVLDDLEFVSLGNSANTLEDSSQLSDCESVMELGWSWKKLLLDLLPKGNGGIDQVRLHLDDVIVVLLWVEQHFQDSSVDVLNGSLRSRGHVDGEEVSLESVWNIVSTGGWVVHGS